jgi:RNA polymerase primary sigma factor
MICSTEEKRMEERPEENEEAMSFAPNDYVLPKRLLTRDEETVLIAAAKSGDERARNQMIESNMRLILSIARRYRCRSMALEDLLNEGVFGLIIAVERFDSSRGHKFSTYATFWVRQVICRAIQRTDRMIRLPAYGWDAERTIRRAEEEFSDTHGRAPSMDELATLTGLSRRLVHAVLVLGPEPMSLDAMCGSEEDTALGEFLEDTNAVDPAKTGTTAVHYAAIHQYLGRLSDLEQEVIRMRYGFYGGRIYSLQEIADQYTRSREGIRQTQTRALRKLHNAIEGDPAFDDGAAGE